MTTNEMIAVLRAVEDGKEIDIRRKCAVNWIPITPRFCNFVDNVYRLKREPRVTDNAFITTGEWLIQEGAKLVAAVCKRPTPAQIRLAKELRGRAANWRKQMDDLTNDTGTTF